MLRLLVATLLLALPAAADPVARFTQALGPALTIERTERQRDGRSWSGIAIGFSDYRVTLPGAQGPAETGEGAARLRAANLLALSRKDAERRAALRLEDLAIELDVDAPCAGWAGLAAGRALADDIHLGPFHRLRAEDLTLGLGADCRQGTLTADRLELRTPSGASLTLGSVSLSLSDEPAGTRLTGRIGALDLDIREGAPTFGGRDIEIDLLMPGLIPAETALACLSGAPCATRSLWVEAFNRAALGPVAATITAASARFLTSDIVPPEMTANFRRVGLTTIHGRMAASGTLENGLLDMRLDLDATALATIGLSFEMTAWPYSDEIRRAAWEGTPLGLRGLPDLRLRRARLDYAETGLQRTLVDLTGQTTLQNLETLLLLAADSLPEASTALLRGLQPDLRRLLARAAEGVPLAFDLDPGDAIELLRIPLLFLTDPDRLRDWRLATSPR